MLTSWLKYSWIPFVFGGALAASCSSLSCGEGTEQEGSFCIPIDGNGGQGGEGSGVGDVEFDGALAAGPASATSILVTWLPASDDSASYHIYVATTEDGFNFSTPTGVAPPGSTTFEIINLDEDTKYFVIVRAVVDGVEIENSEVVEVTTGADTEAPDFAGVDAAETVVGGAVELSWEAATDDLSPAGALVYFAYVGLTADEIDLDTPLGVSNPGATSMTVVMPDPDAEYVFVVRVRDAAGNLDDNEKTVTGTSGEDVQAPVFGGCKSATPKTASALTVTWDPASDDIASDEKILYNLYASETPDGHNFSEPHATIEGGSSGVVPGLDRDTKYYVICRAADPSGNEEENVRLQSAKTKDDDEPPVFGGIVAIENLGAESVDLVWAAATDNQTPEDEIIYDVFISDSEGNQDFEEPPFLSSEPGVTAITLEDLDSNTEHFIVVLARDSAGNLSVDPVEQPVTTLVSLRKDIELPIFANKCALAGCHSTSSAEQNLRLDAGFSWASMVNVQTTTQASGVLRVVPGSPGTSHIVARVKSTNQTGEPPKMPPTEDFVTATEIATIELWISQNAPNN